MEEKCFGITHAICSAMKIASDKLYCSKNDRAAKPFFENKKTTSCATDSVSVLEISSESEFEKILSATSNPVVADFFAPYCIPCRIQEPIIEECAKVWRQQVTVIKINVEHLPALTARLQVRGIPCILFFKNGDEIKRFTGVQAKQTLLTALADSV